MNVIYVLNYGNIEISQNFSRLSVLRSAQVKNPIRKHWTSLHKETTSRHKCRHITDAARVGELTLGELSAVGELLINQYDQFFVPT